jgi:hypothetical protein
MDRGTPNRQSASQQDHVEATSMLREQMINFLQAMVIFLLITNAFTITAVVCAIRLLTGAPLEKRQATGMIGRRLELMFPSKG